MDVPSTSHNGIANAFVFEGTTNGHRLCAIRNCAAQGEATSDPAPAIGSDRLRAILPGLGLGTVIEGNQIANCAVGIHYSPGASDKAAQEIVAWNNYFRNVSIGVFFENNIVTTQAWGTVGRLILMDNIIEIATATGSLSGSQWQTGIRLNTTQTEIRFQQVVLRKNTIRDVQIPIGVTTGVKGIHVEECSELIAENNILNNIAVTSAVIVEHDAGNSNKTKFFNNQNNAGVLLRGYKNGVRILELEDQVQDVLLPL